MKKEFIICYISIGLMVILCVISLVLGKWFNLFCNAMWLFIAYMVLLAGKRFSEIRREKREIEIFNSKLIDIMAERASKAGNVGTVFDKIRHAREEALKESKEE